MTLARSISEVGCSFEATLESRLFKLFFGTFEPNMPFTVERNPILWGPFGVFPPFVFNGLPVFPAVHIVHFLLKSFLKFS